jgi:hypothetical protein
MTSNYVGAHVLNTKGEIQGYSAPTQKLVEELPEQAFPDEDSGATFIHQFKRSQGRDNDNVMLDSSDATRDAIMFLFQLPPDVENNRTARRIIGESVARQMNIQAAAPITTGFSYLYPMNFEYRADDPAYGPQHKPMADHLLNKDAIKVYINQFQDLEVDVLATDDDALVDIFGYVSEDNRAITFRGGHPEVAFNPGP